MDLAHKSIADAKRAYELRHRQTLLEQYFTEAWYHAKVAKDDEKAASAYRTVLEINPDHLGAVNNLGNAYVRLRQFDRGEDMLLRRLEMDSTLAQAWINLVWAQAMQERETAIRRALGARNMQVVGAVLRQALLLAALGVVVGSAAALLVTRALTAFLFEVSPTDATAFAGAALVLIAVAVVACLVPSVRASLVDPVTVLREE